jgi:hypothetical protein
MGSCRVREIEEGKGAESPSYNINIIITHTHTEKEKKIERQRETERDQPLRQHEIRPTISSISSHKKDFERAPSWYRWGL